MESNRNDTNEFIYKRLRQLEIKLMDTKGEMYGGGVNLELRTHIYTLLYINRLLTKTYNIAQGTQYFAVTYMGKESEKVNL